MPKARPDWATNRGLIDCKAYVLTIMISGMADLVLHHCLVLGWWRGDPGALLGYGCPCRAARPGPSLPRLHTPQSVDMEPSHT